MGGGVRQMLKIADEGGRGGFKTPKIADIKCEQPRTGSFVSVAG